MDAILRSDKVSLQIQHEYGVNEEELWQTFRRTAVEPGQASFPEFVSFADECLLCARILINAQDPPNEADTQQNNPLSGDAPTSEWPAPGAPQLRPPSPPPYPTARRAGIVYLHAGPANLPAGEASIGVIIERGMQGRGYAREAVQLVLRWAFEELKFHRVQAAVLDTPFKDRALRLFIGSGFTHEGTKRRAVYQPEEEGIAGTWKDVTYLAMLDTEWMLRSTLIQHSGIPARPVVTAWDEMFARHSREREELVRWEEKHGRMKKWSSTETLRENARNAGQDLAYLTDDAVSSVGEPSLSGSSPPSPKPNVVVTWEEDARMTDGLDNHEVDQEWEEVDEAGWAARLHDRWQGTDGSFLELSPRFPALVLPSIPSTGPSEGNLQSPRTIPSANSTPPFSPSPSPAPSSVPSSWTEDEDEEIRPLRGDSGLPFQFMTSYDSAQPGSHPHAGPISSRTRSRSSSASSSSADSWSDAQSSACGSWDLVSNASDHSHRGFF